MSIFSRTRDIPYICFLMNEILIEIVSEDKILIEQGLQLQATDSYARSIAIVNFVAAILLCDSLVGISIS